MVARKRRYGASRGLPVALRIVGVRFTPCGGMALALRKQEACLVPRRTRRDGTQGEGIRIFLYKCRLILLYPNEL